MKRIATQFGCPPPLRRSVVAAAMAGATSLGAHAIEIDTGSPDWTVRWDNSIAYTLGIRTQKINDNIGNNPVFAESDYSVKQGGVVTNRLSDLMELDAESKGGFGARMSASLFNDFAFRDHVRTNPGDLAPGTPYSSLGAYTNNEFSGYTKRYYKDGAGLLDAFAFANFKVGDHDASVDVGRLTKYWGNATFFGTLGINYSQNAADNIKGASAPGSQAKELAIPREQLYLSTQITQDLVVEGQYFLKFKGNLLPEGGTYLSFADFLTRGPQGAALTSAFGLGQHAPDITPKNVDSNYGLKLAWAPSALRGAVSAYYRQLDETQPWMPLVQYDPQTGEAENYHLAYARHVKLYGLSLEKQIDAYSLGAEISYRRGTALNSSAANPNDALGTEGARGNVTNVIVNTVGGLTPTPVWDTGIFLAEVGYSHLNSVTSNAAMFNGTSNAAACPSGSVANGCSTRNAVLFAGLFKPQWLGVFPSVDLGLPLFAMYGVKGNTASMGAPVNEHGVLFTAGIEALVQQKWDITLQYNGYHSKFNGITNGGAAAGVANGTPGFPTFYAGGNGTFMYNDKGWVSLTVQASF